MTDLERMDPEVRRTADGVEVSAVVPTAVGPVRKRLRVGHDEAVVELTHEFDWGALPGARFDSAR